MNCTAWNCEKNHAVNHAVDKKIIEILKENPSASQRMIAEQINETYNTVRYRMSLMKRNNIVIKEGDNKSTKWIVKK
ncbi:MAG: AsnC family protein [Oscillospiraceae bacterium]|nr:AsnC family protein [Oscillospiraceae bacterium]